jgi:hypothetical protein
MLVIKPFRKLHSHALYNFIERKLIVAGLATRSEHKGAISEDKLNLDSTFRMHLSFLLVRNRLEGYDAELYLS